MRVNPNSQCEDEANGELNCKKFENENYLGYIAGTLLGLSGLVLIFARISRGSDDANQPNPTKATSTDDLVEEQVVVEAQAEPADETPPDHP